MGLLASINKAAYEENLAKELRQEPSVVNRETFVLPAHYDEIVNLGFNCEVSFKIKEYFNKLNSFMFSWSYSHDRELLLKSLDNMHDILSGEVEPLPETNMFKCKKYNMSYHAKVNRDQFMKNLTLDQFAVRESLAELRSRASHLADKTEALFKSEKTTLFIYKLKFTNDWASDNDYIKRLQAKLDELYVSRKYTLLVILESAHSYKLTVPENSRLQFRTVTNFTNFYNVSEGNKDSGWDKIFDQFFSRGI